MWRGEWRGPGGGKAGVEHIPCNTHAGIFHAMFGFDLFAPTTQGKNHSCGSVLHTQEERHWPLPTYPCPRAVTDRAMVWNIPSHETSV